MGQTLQEDMNNSNTDNFDMTKDECATHYKYLKTTF